MSEKLIETQKINELPVVDKLEDVDYLVSVVGGKVMQSKVSNINKNRVELSPGYTKHNYIEIGTIYNVREIDFALISFFGYLYNTSDPTIATIFLTNGPIGCKTYYRELFGNVIKFYITSLNNNITLYCSASLYVENNLICLLNSKSKEMVISNKKIVDLPDNAIKI